MISNFMRRLAVLGLGALALYAGGAWAQGTPASSLATALAQASARDPQLASMQARQAEAQAGVDLAQGWTPGPPAVSLNHLSDRFNQNQGRREWEVEVGTPLWLPGQQGARQQVARAALVQNQSQLDARKLALAGELRQNWWALAQAQASFQLATQRLMSARQLEGDVQRRYQSGDVARVDFNLAQAETLSAQADVLGSQLELTRAEQAYTGLTGTPPASSLPPEPLPLASMEQGDELSLHPRWLAFDRARALAASKLALVDASRRDAPELALRWTSQRSDTLTPHDQAIGIKLTVPLSSSDRVRQDSAAARADLAQADGELALATQGLQQDLMQARQALTLAERQLALARQRRDLTADNLRLTQKAFELGEQDLAMLLRARQADREAQATLTRQALTLHAAQSQLLQAQGRLPEAQP